MSVEGEAAAPEQPQVTQVEQTVKETPPAAPAVKKKRPLLASFLSFLAPGIGQYYNDQWQKALILLAAYFILGVIAVYFMLQTLGVFLVPVLIVIWLFSIYDAFREAKKINRAVA